MSAAIEVRANGIRFHVREQGQGARLALCLHGFPQLGMAWRHQLPLLARLGYRAWAPDLRGYGRSERPRRIRDYAIETLIDDVAALIEAGGGRATLLAHDWGAIIGWYVAMRRPELVERLVILNTPHPAPLARELRGARQLRRSFYVALFQMPWLPERVLANARRIDGIFLSSAVEPARFDPDALRAYRDAALAPGAMRAMLAYYRAYVRGGGVHRQRERGFPHIEAPTLMIWGERDPFLLRETTIGTADWVRDLTVRYLPDAGHWVHEEANEAVNAILESWLKGETVPQAWELRSA